MTVNPRVIDISHYQKLQRGGAPLDFRAAANAGIWGVINKASEGYGYGDDSYRLHRKPAIDAGLLWGAYHFLRPGDIKQQVDWFISHAEPDANTLMALDHEDARVSATSAREFIDRLDQKLGRSNVLYSGNVIKEQLRNYHDPFWGRHRWWLAQYSSVMQGQASWSSIWLWQYTGDGNGLLPHTIPGIGSGIDINHFGRSRDRLMAEWAGGESIPAPAPVIDPNAKPMLMFGAKGAAVTLLQQKLNAKGVTPPLKTDGDFGDKTQTAVRAFQRAHNLAIDGWVGDNTWTALNG